MFQIQYNSEIGNKIELVKFIEKVYENGEYNLTSINNNFYNFQSTQNNKQQTHDAIALLRECLEYVKDDTTQRGMGLYNKINAVLAQQHHM